MGLMGAPGFDDAPFWDGARAALPSPINVVYPYYESPLFLRRQLEWWSALPEYIRQWLKITIVDDASPTAPAVSVVSQQRLWPLDIKLFRVDLDVRWNWLAARNIGMHHADDGWSVLTDMDHVIPERTFDALLYRGHDEGAIYRFSRVEHTGAKIHPHPNSMFMTKEMFWRVGGYDEALSGFYGTDGDWRKRCARTAKVWTLREELVRHEYQEDSSVTAYRRKQPEDAGKKPIIAKRRAIRGWRPKVLSFPYHRVPL